MVGLVNRHTTQSLPLKASSTFAEVNGFAARLLATLTYYNDCEYDIEGLFVFPQDERTTVVEFEATIEERHVSTEIREKSSTVDLNSAYGIEEREDELFSLSIGRIPPLASVFVQVGLITELLSDPKSRSSLFVLPSVFTPRLYTTDENENQRIDLYGSPMLISDLPRKTYEPYSFDLQLEVVAPCLLAGCSSSTHAIQVDADSRATNASRIHITIAEPHTYDREIEILLHLSHPFDPYVLIEEGKKTILRADNTEIIPNAKVGTPEEMIEMFSQKPAIMLNFTPQLTGIKRSSSEFIFLVDRSGSMSGKHIFQVKETLVLLLKSLPSNSFFNIVGFGSYYRSLFQESQLYNEENLDKALNYVHKMRSDLGGTNLILPLEFIFDQPSKRGRPRVVFLLTDGGVSNTLDVVDLVRKHSHTCRFFTFGIGPEACPHLVQGLAGPSAGQSFFITEEQRIPPKVLKALDRALAPAITDIEVSWHLPEGYDVIQSPSRVPFVFDGERLVLYGILSRPLEDGKESPKTPQKRRMDRSMRSFSNNSVKVFWFDDDLEYLPEEQLLVELDERLTDDVFSDSDVVYNTNSTDHRRHQLRREENPKGTDNDSTTTLTAQTLRHTISDDSSATNDEPTRRFYSERDSGVGFSMDEGDKTEDDVPISKNGISNESQAQSDPPPAPLNVEKSQDTKFSVFKKSDLLEKIGVSSNFAAVVIKGFVGDEEFEQVIPFPIGRSGGFSKRPTIHQLLARSLIRELQIAEQNQEENMRKIGMLAGQSKIYCRLTSFASVDQYCFENEILSALRFASKEHPEAEIKRKVLNLERKGGFTTGLGRRLPCPEGSDQESIGSENLENHTGDGEEPTDLYRLDRSPTIESSDSSPIKSGYNSPCHKTNYGGRHVPPLSNRYVVGEKSAEENTACISPQFYGRVSPVLPKLFKDYQPYVNLLKLQSIHGYWQLNEGFADCLELSLHSIEQASPLADSTACAFVSEELEEILKNFRCEYGTEIWATALGLAWLVHLHSDSKNEWFLLARKADVWLGECEYPRGFTRTDLKKLAFQALLLMRRHPDSPLEKTVTHK